MKRFVTLITLGLLILITLIIQAADHDVSKEFQQKLEEKLKQEVNYYDRGSVKIEKSLTMNGQIFKLLTADDPKTEENEEKIEEYQANFTIALVKYQLKRDSIFYIDKYDLYYFDNDKQEFLILSNIVENKEAEAFFSDHAHALNKEIQPTSIMIVLGIISMLLIFPILIMIFHNKAKTTVNK